MSKIRNVYTSESRTLQILFTLGQPGVDCTVEHAGYRTSQLPVSDHVRFPHAHVRQASSENISSKLKLHKSSKVSNTWQNYVADFLVSHAIVVPAVDLTWHKKIKTKGNTIDWKKIKDWKHLTVAIYIFSIF